MKPPLQDTEEAKFAMAPMIDMVFLLLVFFMIASRLSVIQTVELEIPEADSAVVPKERPNRLTINIDRGGDMWVGGLFVEKDIQALRVAAQEYKDSYQDIKVYLRADKETEHEHIRKVMDAMAELGLDNFIFGAHKP
ncbi:MAG: biopolymer transporter ExbD [Verrucomicrobia bacterium]|nr:biopolymer transporter ExbD [Verrucomicrobiota bacterium]MDA1086960.1 biopolymer transporter ExbD [Verrucomicrobiota bacterium]